MGFKEIITKFLKDNKEYERFLFNAQKRLSFNLQWYPISMLFYGIITDKKVLSKWRYFVNHNLHINQACIKEGDIIQLNGIISNKYIVKNVDWHHFLCSVYNANIQNRNTPFSISMARIKDINGKKIDKHPIEYNEYYITKNRKTYGKTD